MIRCIHYGVADASFEESEPAPWQILLAARSPFRMPSTQPSPCVHTGTVAATQQAAEHAAGYPGPQRLMRSSTAWAGLQTTHVYDAAALAQSAAAAMQPSRRAALLSFNDRRNGGSGAGSCAAAVWRLQGAAVHRLKAHRGRVALAAVSQQEDWLLTAGRAPMVKDTPCMIR